VQDVLLREVRHLRFGHGLNLPVFRRKLIC